MINEDGYLHDLAPGQYYVLTGEEHQRATKQHLGVKIDAALCGQPGVLWQGGYEFAEDANGFYWCKKCIKQTKQNNNGKNRIEK